MGLVAQLPTCAIRDAFAGAELAVPAGEKRATLLTRSHGVGHAPSSPELNVVLECRGSASGRRKYAGREAKIRPHTAACGWVVALVGSEPINWRMGHWREVS